MSSRPNFSPTDRGYTLVEMLVVLALLAMMAAVAWPSLRAPWGRTQVEDAGNCVRIALARARVKAIESAAAWQFRYQPGTGCFAIEPAVVGAGDDGEQATNDQRIDDELPHGVCFLDPQSFDASLPEAARAMPAGDADWSSPVFFFPNGRATSARLVLADARGLSVDVSLRGMTGTAKVGKSYRAEKSDEEMSP